MLSCMQYSCNAAIRFSLIEPFTACFVCLCATNLRNQDPAFLANTGPNGSQQCEWYTVFTLIGNTHWRHQTQFKRCVMFNVKTHLFTLSGLYFFLLCTFYRGIKSLQTQKGNGDRSCSVCLCPAWAGRQGSVCDVQCNLNTWLCWNASINSI